MSRNSSKSLICFGTGDGAPCDDRNHASFLYRFGRTTTLMDCGESIDRSYKANGPSYDAIDAIFLSHLHSDHIGGFFMFMQGMWLEGRQKPLKVYLPGKAIKLLRHMLETVFLFEEVLPFHLQLLPLGSQKTIRVRDVQITPFPTTHLDRTRAQFGKKYRVDFSAYCFQIEHKGVRIAHSADLGKPWDLDLLTAQPLDLLVCELSHFTPNEIFPICEIARSNKSPSFILPAFIAKTFLVCASSPESRFQVVAVIFPKTGTN